MKTYIVNLNKSIWEVFEPKIRTKSLLSVHFDI